MNVGLLREGKKLVLACEVVEKEIARYLDGSCELRCFDYGLHRTPENMAKALQSEIDTASARPGAYRAIVLGYGLCSNGIVGITARTVPVVVPRVHDCISLFLGSTQAYKAQACQCPGTYYLTPGWIDKGETPMSKYAGYAASYGEETARWVLHEELKHYTRIVLINTGAYTAIDPYRQIARKNADFLGLSYEELEGPSTLFRRLVLDSTHEDMLIMAGGEVIRQEMFLAI